MYNRYIPQSDGSYQKNRVADRHQAPQQQKRTAPPSATRHSTVEPESPPVISNSRNETSAGNFLKQLLPKEFDTGDLLIVLLLLLMSGDCEEEKSNALLTLALYFFM